MYADQVLLAGNSVKCMGAARVELRIVSEMNTLIEKISPFFGELIELEISMKNCLGIKG